MLFILFGRKMNSNQLGVTMSPEVNINSLDNKPNLRLAKTLSIFALSVSVLSGYGESKAEAETLHYPIAELIPIHPSEIPIPIPEACSVPGYSENCFNDGQVNQIPDHFIQFVGQAEDEIYI